MEVKDGCLIKYNGREDRVVIPASVTSIGKEAFRGSKVKEVVIPNSCREIGSLGFAECSSLTECKIPNSVTIIGEQAFWDCSALKECIIGNSVTIIGDYAFYDCSSLRECIIPNSVTIIEKEAFRGCSINGPMCDSKFGDEN